MAEQATELKEQIYVWAKTERAGDIVVTDGTKGEFTLFTDGSQIFTNMISEMLLPAKNMTQAENICKPFRNIDTTVPGTPEPVKETKTEPGTDSIMVEMLRKISAKNTIQMPLQLNIPSHEVYDLFKDQMDITKADLNEQILALVMSQIDNLQAQLKPQAEEFIKLYYDGRKSTRTKSTRSTESSTGKSGPDITY